MLECCVELCGQCSVVSKAVLMDGLVDSVVLSVRVDLVQGRVTSFVSMLPTSRCSCLVATL